MPRRPRLHVPGGCYHAILRGNHREALFGSISDRRVLNDIVAEVIDDCGARIHAFCWMTNHLHLLVQISNQPLGKVVQKVAQRYSRYRQKRLGVVGHLFERRHIAKLVDVDAYFLALLRYIHLNPVKADVVEDPSKYPWTSHRAFLGIETIHWLTTDFGLSLFGNDLGRARTAYRRFILEAADGDDHSDFDVNSHPADSRVIGTDEFISKIPTTQHLPRTLIPLENLAEEVCMKFRTSIDVLRSPLRAKSISAVRVEFTRRALAERAATVSDVARFLNRNPSSIGRLLERHCETRVRGRQGKQK